MPLRVGLLTAVHLHAWGYVHCLKTHPDVELVGIFDDDVERGELFAQQSGLAFVGYMNDLFDRVDAVVVVSENTRHAELSIAASKAGKHVLCEKPLATTMADATAMVKAADDAGKILMTAFPCRFSPAWARLKERVAKGEIGAIKGICATNRGRCPGGWFIEKDKSGGGAMIDHTVHVTDLLRDLLGENPSKVQAQTGSNMYGKDWDDTAMITLEFPSGIFATLDSSWSRPQSYKTWGDVTMNVVGEKGVIELDMFGQAVGTYHSGTVTHTAAGYGSNADDGLVKEFVAACLEKRQPSVTGVDGLEAAKVAIAGYQSAAEGRAIAL